MKKSEKDKYSVKPEELTDLISQVNKEDGFTVPENVLIKRNNDLRLCLEKLLTISPNLDFTNHIESALSKMDDSKDHITLHFAEFAQALKQYYEITDSVMNSCKDTFAILLTTLKVFQLQS